MKNEMNINEYTPDFSAISADEYPVNIYRIDVPEMYMGMIRWHWHDEIEIGIVESGCAVLMTGETECILTEGQGYFLNQDTLHSIHTISGKPCILRAVLFNHSCLFGYGQTFMVSNYLLPVLYEDTLHTIHLTGENVLQNEIMQNFYRIFSLYEDKRYGYELSVKARLFDIWAAVLSMAVSHMQPELKNTHPSVDEMRVKRAILYIEEHHMEALTLEDIASSIHLSKSECCRSFKRTLSLTPFEYLMKYRIFESAKKIYRRDAVSDSISTLAASVGFNNTSYYNKLFRKYLGCTPSEYKGNMRHRVL